MSKTRTATFFASVKNCNEKTHGISIGQIRSRRCFTVVHCEGCSGDACVLPRYTWIRYHVSRAGAADIFFGIVQRGGAMLMFKAIGVEPIPNYTRDIGKGVVRWDAYFYVPDPDALAAEFESRKVEFFRCLRTMMTACADSRSRTPLT